MSRIKFLKDHVNGIKKGDEGEFTEGRANYLVRTGVAEYVTEAEPKQAVKQTKQKLKTTKSELCKTC
ncbi:hypothetical protein GQF61_04170 [Sphingobacterium sp. DK4209]|uniref:Uncharacterized protein n=1 Tax=Sphingobacterium zhuxiongii TaxID=2662364 RepID=A0A5Q0QCU9_9SPHI|nr:MULTISPECIES: hypothetical protein [unclassified Sphingobacterium]MVZ65035.1 hypothetical protein [Sphingobacterium sp. DK4209]QGA25372.1 hypothetical protein GFH32_03125 [Sphingobacterium sp. dk4302]